MICASLRYLCENHKITKMKLLKSTVTAAFFALALMSCEQKTTTTDKTDATAQNTETNEDLGKPADVTADPGTFKIAPLAYEYNALGDYIDAKTMNVHYSKHYVGYLNKLNKEIEGKPQASQTIEEILKNMDMNNSALRNNAGGYYNHNLYFDMMGPDAGGQPTGELLEAINRDFGSFDAFKEKFSKAGADQFGSGWAWLVSDNSGKLSVGSTPNQDNPLMPGTGISGTPVLAMDVWEHAYYLKYQNKRADYITNFFNVVNWNKVAEYYAKAKG